MKSLRTHYYSATDFPVADVPVRLKDLWVLRFCRCLNFRFAFGFHRLSSCRSLWIMRDWRL